MRRGAAEEYCWGEEGGIVFGERGRGRWWIGGRQIDGWMDGWPGAVCLICPDWEILGWIREIKEKERQLGGGLHCIVLVYRAQLSFVQKV